jgi:hypothetical protein
MKQARLSIITITIFLLAGSVYGQNRKPLPQSEQDRYLVSAKSGIVNIVDGDVSSTNDKGESRPLVARDTLGNGETVRTGSGSRIEVLLNPGCYLRVDENSRFVFEEHSLKDLKHRDVSDSGIDEDSRFVFEESPFKNLKIRLLSGSAIIEAAAVDRLLTIEVPGNKLMVMRNGLYRVDVRADGSTEVIVRKGRMFVGSLAVKEGRKVVLNSAPPALAKLDKKDVDGFDDWSKYRAKTLIAANKALSSRSLKRSGLLISINDMWVFDRNCGCYAFLPGRNSIYSPYGWCYSNYNPYWNRYNDSIYGRGPIYGSPSTPGNGGGGGGGYPGRPGAGNPGGGNPAPVITNPGPRFGGGENGGRYGSGPERDAPAPIRRP